MINPLYRYISFLLLGLLYFSMPFTVVYAANNQAGKVLLTRGEVFAKREAGELILKRGSLLFSQDEIHVGENGRTQFRTLDGGVISLQGNTVFKIKRYSYKNNNEKDVAFFELISGGLRTVTGVIGKADKEAYEMQTPLATIGIRGTLFEIEIVGKTTYIVLRRGKIFTLSTISGCSLSLTEGQYLQIGAGGCKVSSKVPARVKKLFESGHSSTVTTNSVDDTINIIKNSDGDVVPDFDEASRENEIISDFDAKVAAAEAATAVGSSASTAPTPDPYGTYYPTPPP